jgi:hypothetical protein
MRLFAKAKSLFYFEIKPPKSKEKAYKKNLDKQGKIITQKQRGASYKNAPFFICQNEQK